MPEGLNNVLCVVWSCIKMHATHEIMNYALRFIIRATSCMLRTKSWITHWGFNPSCNKLHATDEIINYALRFNPSCNMLHATHEIMNYALRLIIHATDSQTLAGYKKKVRSKFTLNFDRTWWERISGFSICSNIFHKYRQLRPHRFG